MIAALLAAVVLQLVYLGGLIAAGRNPLTQLRTAFVHDQLGYLAMSSDIRGGFSSLVEPVTRTGVNHYPPLYYDGVGLIARVTGSTVVTSWNVMGILLQVVLVLTLSLVISAVSGRWWVGLLAPAPLMMGTFSTWTDDSWYSPIGDSHAVLWGPFGDLFSKNAGAGGMVVGLTVTAALYWAWSTDRTSRSRWAITWVGAAVIGMLSAWQTYSFLVFVYLLIYVAAACGIRAGSRRRVLATASIVLFAAVWFVGPAVAGTVGQLPMMIVGLLPALPGFVAAAIATRGKLAVAAAIGTVVSVPQIVWTLSGVLGGDPFLNYRVASTNDLGVPLLEGLLRATPALLPLAAALVLSIKVGDAVVTVVASAALVCLPFLALNDVWGANTEPYRFWVAGYPIAGVVALLCWATLLRRSGGSLEHRVRARRAVVATLVVTTALWTASLRDLVEFNFSPEMQATWSPSTPRERAITELADQAQDLSATDLLTTDDCIDPRTTKAGSSERIAYYHTGMAWPDHRAEIDRIIAARARGDLDSAAMRAADVGWLLTDSRCDSRLEVRYASSLQLVDSAAFTVAPGEAVIDQTVLDETEGLRSDAATGTIRLWRVVD